MLLLSRQRHFITSVRVKNITDSFFERFDFENIGGTPVLGVNANVVIGHGISNRKAIMNMIFRTVEVVKADLANRIKTALSNGKN